MPLGESMLSTLRSNKSVRLDKSKHFRKTYVGNYKKSMTACNLPEASPELILKIREKMIKENKKNRTIRVTISLVLVVITILVVYILA